MEDLRGRIIRVKDSFINCAYKKGNGRVVWCNCLKREILDRFKYKHHDDVMLSVVDVILRAENLDLPQGIGVESNKITITIWT